MKTKSSPQSRLEKPVRAGKNGNVPPVERQFGKPNGNPRHNGAWKKEDTARYKLEQMMKLTRDELKKIWQDTEAPLFERKLANAIMTGKWNVIESMINQVYGSPKQLVENHNIEYKPLVDLTKRKKNGANNGAK